ncbi:MAG: DUF2339 domain-containing protein [Acidobacteriia bacterium]|nr:DUF2339 domain-containing protein [Terriglobia bacterium]
MDEDPRVPSPLELKVDELLRRLTDLEEIVARQTQRIFALESQRGIPTSSSIRAEQKPKPEVTAGPIAGVPPPSAASLAPPPPASAGQRATSPVLPPTAVPLFRESARTPNEAATSLEARIGGNWLLWVGIVAIVLGTVYFLKLAFENNWVGPSMRVAIGAFFGIGFVYWGEELQKREYPVYGQAVTGGGNAILYLSIYAAFNFYHLIPASAAFFLMILVTATLSVLAARYGSLALAFIGLVGGFMTPIWLSTGEDHQVILLSYIALLVAGVAYLARARNWAVLNYSSFILTLVIFLGWAVRFYSGEKRGATEFFLCLFAGLFLFVGAVSQRQADGPGQLLARVLMGSSSILFYLFSIINLFDHGTEMFSFIVLFDVIVLIAAMGFLLKGLGWAAFLLNALSIFPWLMIGYREEHLASTLLSLTVIFVFFLFWPLGFIFGKKMGTSSLDLGVTVSNGLGYFGALYFLLEQHHHGLLGLLAVSMGAVYFAAANAIWKKAEKEKRFALITLGVAITFVTLAIPIQLKQNWITLSWAVEAVVLTWVAVRTSSVRMHLASCAVMVLTVFRLFAFDKTISSDAFQLVFNKRFFTFLSVILACYAIAWLLKKMPLTPDSILQQSFRAFLLLASLLTVILMSMEASSYYDAKQWSLLRAEGARFYDPSRRFRALENGKQLAYSVLWGIYSVTLIVVGIIKRFRDIRWFAMALFAVTIAKVFLVDLSSLERAYRVLSMIVLGAILLLAAYLYQRYRKLIFE